MLAKIGSATLLSLAAVPIEVEVDVTDAGLPSFSIVGLPDKAVKESRERVRSAIKNSGADYPRHRITVNLAPADIPKVGPAFDLPIALGILIASGQVPNQVSDALFVGELSLDGSLKHTNGVLPMTICAKENLFSRIFVPKVDSLESSLVFGCSVYPISSLKVLVNHLMGLTKVSKTKHVKMQSFLENEVSEYDFSEVIGQESVKRALEIAAAGAHNIIMKGSPGAGKTMLARALSGILPSLTEDESLEVTKVYSISGKLPAGQSFVTSRPFRSPHHTTSRNGLIGGGSSPSPGEVSLAHRGVLFLDEFPEFPRHVLEALRQPLEDGEVTISRSKSTATYPAKFMLVAAFNPCPCGYFNDPKRECTCTGDQIRRYQKRISGPILDRIDMHLEVPNVNTQKLVGYKNSSAEPSSVVQKRVQNARNRQAIRFTKLKIKSNAEMSSKDIKKFVELSGDGLSLMKKAMLAMDLSARSYFKVIKIARTIADLTGEDKLSVNHLAEALQYRPRQEN